MRVNKSFIQHTLFDQNDAVVAFHKLLDGDTLQARCFWRKRLETLGNAPSSARKTTIAHYNLGTIAYKDNNWDKAKTEYESALKSSGSIVPPTRYGDITLRANCYFMLACIYENRNNYKNAAEFFNKASEHYNSINNSSMQFEAIYHKALVLEKARAFVSAINELNNARRIIGSCPEKVFLLKEIDFRISQILLETNSEI